MNHPEEVKALMLGESQKAELVTESSIQHTPRTKKDKSDRWPELGNFLDCHTLKPFRSADELQLWQYTSLCFDEWRELYAEREALVSALRGLVIIADGYLRICQADGYPKCTGAAEVAIKRAEDALASVSPKEKAIK
jgi:hypothetical protein